MMKNTFYRILATTLAFHFVQSEAKLRIGIVGAGPAGLASAKHALANGFECEVLEATSDIGGTWVYTDKIGNDEYGYPIYTAMYKDLRTNLPKEAMNFPELLIEGSNKSFVDKETILNYLHSYADKFDLKKHIKFNRLVTNIVNKDDKWIVTSLDKLSKSVLENEYDVVMVCNGHSFEPYSAPIKNIEFFDGEKKHSHHYRTIEAYTNKSVLVIGGGPSGIDLTFLISEVASKVVISRHKTLPIKLNFSANVEIKPDVQEVLNGTTILFIDGTTSSVDTILYCTGYNYSFPFLDKSVGVTWERHHVKPLYKHIINVLNPKIAFIGIPSIVLHFRMFDMQVRFYMEYLKGSMTLPSREEMLADIENELEIRKNAPMKIKPHGIGPFLHDKCFDDMAKLANVTPMPEVYSKIYKENYRSLVNNIGGYREYQYEIIDDHTFKKYE